MSFARDPAETYDNFLTVLALMMEAARVPPPRRAFVRLEAR